LNLTPELINRLVALKSLLDLGDMELASVASSRLERDLGEPEIAGILSALEDHRYAEAAGLIDKLLSDGTRLARWTDPEIALLEVELERVTTELADLETEQAELEHLISRFQAAHNETLDDRRKERLKARIAGIRDSLERTRTHIHEIKRSSTYQTMLDNADWAELFEKQAKLLDQEIENLSVTLEEIQDDDA